MHAVGDRADINAAKIPRNWNGRPLKWVNSALFIYTKIKYPYSRIMINLRSLMRLNLR
jgi:hypothetical protein